MAEGVGKAETSEITSKCDASEGIDDGTGAPELKTPKDRTLGAKNTEEGKPDKGPKSSAGNEEPVTASASGTAPGRSNDGDDDGDPLTTEKSPLLPSSRPTKVARSPGVKRISVTFEDDALADDENSHGNSGSHKGYGAAGGGVESRDSEGAEFSSVEVKYPADGCCNGCCERCLSRCIIL